MKDNFDISVITPSYNMLLYLERCAASLADQEGGRFEHIVMDGDSNDGSVEWLAKQKYIKSISEKDNGMYDAVNKGFKLAKGNILAYLNCDEQYLPGTLTFVKDYFERNPDVEIIFGDVLLTRPDGSLIAYRKGYQPRWFYILSSHLYVLSSAMFFRRKIVDDGFFFDTRYRTAGDADFLVRLLRSRYNSVHIRKYFSVFTMTGKNLGSNACAIAEKKELLRSAPFYIRIGKPIINAVRLGEKFLSGAYFQKFPLEYSIYISGKEKKRKTFRTNKASFRWRTE